MKKSIAVLFVSVLTCGSSFGAVTNYTNSGTTDPDVLANTNYVGLTSGDPFGGPFQYTGTTGTVAASISSISSLQVSNAGIEGGGGGATGTNTTGGTGLVLQDVVSITIDNVDTNALIRGGSGGTAFITTNLSASARGGTGILVNDASLSVYTPATDPLNFNDGMVYGGDGGSVSGAKGATLDASGGVALQIARVRLNLNGGEFIGGSGGTIFDLGGSTIANGGAGVRTGDGQDNGLDVAIYSLGDGVTAMGGDGGIITSTDEAISATAIGGIGFKHDGYNANFANPALVLNVTGGRYEGGAGGTVTAGGDVDVSGGKGFTLIAQHVVITNGSFIGGSGGTATVNDASRAIADGAAGLEARGFFYPGFSGVVNLDISGGTFAGGAAGVVNAVSGVVSVVEGIGLKAYDSELTISGGTFTGRYGLEVDSQSFDSVVNISGGIFDDLHFTTTTNPAVAPSPVAVNRVSISGGSFQDLILDGPTGSMVTNTGGVFTDYYLGGSGANTLVLGGTNSFNDLYLLGSGTHTLSFSNGASSSGLVLMTNGTATINLWNDDHFADTTLSGGTMNFNGRIFDLMNGSSFALGSAAAQANFNDGLRLNSGAMLDVNLGNVDAGTNFTAKTGSQLRTKSGPSGTGKIVADNLTFESGVTWTIYRDDGVDPASEMVLATGLSSPTHNFVVKDDFVLEDNVEWFRGFTSLTNVGSDLRLSYGFFELTDLLNATGELDQALQDLQANSSDEGLLVIGALGGYNQDFATDYLVESLTRAPEMANSLIQLQGVLAGQIKNRSRNIRSYGQSAAPRGAAGPSHDSKLWLDSHLPSADVRESVKRLDANLPSVDVRGAARKLESDSLVKRFRNWLRGLGPDNSNQYDNSKQWVDANLPSADVRGAVKRLDSNLPSVDVRGSARKLESDSLGKRFRSWLRELGPDLEPDYADIPETYQVWGNAYASLIEQDATDTAPGYDASVGGTIVGIDKRFSNLLLGVGAGYAYTDLSGGKGSDGVVNTGNGTVYASINGERGFIDLSANYSFNDVETAGFEGIGYTASYNAHAFSVYAGGGLHFSVLKDKLILAPEASLLSTYYTREDYTESSSTGLPDKNWDSYDQWSYLASVGMTLSMIEKIDLFELEMEVRPEIRAHWLHEFNANMDGTAYMIDGGVNTMNVALQAREEDLFNVGAGVRFSSWEAESVEFGVDLDAVFAEDYSAYMISGKLIHRF